MSLEHALLDRLEKRSLQIAQQKNEIYGLRQLVNEKMAINEQLAEQITTARLEREQMQHQISELRTECDRIREIRKSLVPKSALKQAVQEAAEFQAEAAKLVEAGELLTHSFKLGRNNGENIKQFLDRICAEVPLESTREALKNAVANVTTDRDRLQNEIVRLNAKVGPLEALYKTLKGYQDNDSILGHGTIIEVAIDKATEALSRLTA